jgi:ribosomal protein L21E
MLKRKSQREKGKIRFSQCFQKLKEGDKVAIVREHSFNPIFPKRIQGLNAVVVGKRGKYYVIKGKDGDEEKTYIISPAHLKKIK